MKKLIILLATLAIANNCTVIKIVKAYDFSKERYTKVKLLECEHKPYNKIVPNVDLQFKILNKKQYWFFTRKVEK